MSRRILAAVFAALILMSGNVLGAETPGAAQDSTASPLAAVHEIYQAAWTLRASGEYAQSVLRSEEGLVLVEKVLADDPDASTRRDLSEMQARLTGLRNEAREDQQHARAVEPGNEADDRVLAARAQDDIEPQLNADVYKYIAFFTGSGRSTFERWLKRSGRYMQLFRSVLQKEGLPPDLVHLVFVESGFNLNARSVSAAVGPWQFLKSTSRLFGLNVNQWVDERKDPEKSTVAAARYLKHLYSIFGDWPLALASYNAGEGTVLRAIKAQGTTNYWDLKLPRQTEDYVPQFMAILAISRDPQKYGFDAVPLDEPMQFDELAFKGPVDLRAIARLCDTSYDTLRALNPAVLRHAATGANGVTVIRVPDGRAPMVMERLSQGTPLPAVNLAVKHKVKRNESLASIAAQYKVSALRLARENGIGRKHPLRAGTLLTIPASLGAPRPEVIDASTDPRASSAYVPARRIGPPATIQGRSDAEGRMKHTVRRGETLAEIASRYNVSVTDLRAWNPLVSGRLRPGVRLKVRTDVDSIAAEARAASDSAQIATIKVRPRRGGSHAASGPSRGVHVVRSGDTLGTIATRYRVSVTSLKRANGISTSRIRAGQRLRIPTG